MATAETLALHRHHQEFAVGQTVEAVESAQHRITGGKQYSVVGYSAAEYAENGFRFSPLVHVLDDFGKLGQFHVYRFRAVAEVKP